MSLATADDPPDLVDVPMTELAPETLQALVESFVLREGTEYGEQEVPLATKVGQVLRQLQRGEARIVFDPATESVDIRLVLGK
jgi:uncharacterized protein YheU (UPF0270 family)